MAFVIRPHNEELTPQVKAFNRRLRTAGLFNTVPESPVSSWLPRIDGRSIFQEFFLALDSEALRGAYSLKHQAFLIGNETISIGHYNPISEGLIDRAFAGLGVQLLMDCLRRQPLLFWLGPGGMSQTITMMLKAVGWSLLWIPFYFRVVRPRTFLRNIEYLRKTPLRRTAADLIAFSGLGVALRGYQAIKTRPSQGIVGELVPDFGEWADAIWEAGRADYRMAAVRDSETLRILYRPDQPRFIRLRVREGARDVGWAVCLSTAMQRDQSFGNMQLGSIIDCFARAEDAWKVVAAATAHLEAAGTDLIVTNQSHHAWRAAMEQTGYFSGPSNSILAMSNKLSKRLDPFDAKKNEIHFTRGDGDGPTHL